MPNRKICVVTGTRAEYGLLYWLMKEIHSDPDLELQIIATGMHLSPEFGLTYQAIEKDGFTINAKVEMLLSSDTPVGVAKSIGLGTISFAEAFDRLCPDIVVVLGDRFEVLAAAQAAMVSKKVIAHIHGGEATEGLIDEPIRHSVTKMAHLHFTAAEEYRNRVVQLGENPDRVFNFGAVGIDNINNLNLLDRDELEDSLNFTLGKTNFLVTYHPVTLSHVSPIVPMKELLAALDCFPDSKVIITKPNADTDGRIISQVIDSWSRENPERVYVATSLGQLRYLSAIQHVDVVVGNSSSGLLEVPTFKKPTVNIGMRQAGRIKAQSVIECDEDREAIKEAIKKALSKEFLSSLSGLKSPYGEGGASEKIKDVLRDVSLKGLLMKKFYNIRAGK